jgi:DNA processing protein
MTGNIKYWIWLSSLVKVPLRKRLRLLKHFTDPAYIWDAGESELKSLGFCSPRIISQITDKEARLAADALMERMHRCDAYAVTLNDRAYPKMLKYIADPPVVLYVRGKFVKDEICVSVVGSRRASHYGLEMARKLSMELAKHGVTVVSGMARGIDSKAHFGALEGGGRTIAVLGCGVDIVYPPENWELMDRIISSGAVISEYLPGTEPTPFYFPARNRIISGLSRGVAIVEAGGRSGSLITADFALEQGRDVYAVPGNINSVNSIGTNRLIRDGAIIITGAGDILDELNVSHHGINVLCTSKILPDICLGGNDRQISMEGKTIAQRLMAGPAHVDVIARDCGISVQAASSVLVMLELSGFVEQLPGKFYKLAE